MKKYILHTLLVLAVCTKLLIAQPNNIVPVSPEAAALTKMVNYPINLNTGLPDISIPFYEINVGGLKLPIALEYHAGGFKINEQSTRSGMGWSLSSDLQIARTVNGLDDFFSGGHSGYINNSLIRAFYPNPTNCPGCDFPFSNQYHMYQLASGWNDGAPDRFSYKLLGKSGSFYFQKNDTGTGYTIVPVPFDNIKIQYNDGAFIITDTDGTIYYFGDPGPGEPLTKGIEMSDVDEPHGGGGVRSAWKCRRIVSSNGTDEVTFSYTAKTVARYRTYHDLIEYYYNDDPCSLEPGNHFTSGTSPMNNPLWNYQDLTANIPFYKISSPKYMVSPAGASKAYFHVPHLNSGDEVVDRIYEKNEGTGVQGTNVAGLSVSDISFRGGKVQFSGGDKLNYIRVLDQNNTEVKSLHLFHSYTAPYYVEAAKFYNGTNFQGTMYLDSLHVRNGTDTYERYALYYTNKFCYGNHLKGHDAWGYPNASTEDIDYVNVDENVPVSLPTISFELARFYRDIYGWCNNFAVNIPFKIGDDDWAEAPDENAMKRGVLRRIVYPTGGITDFDFEANRYTEEFRRVDPIPSYGIHSFLPQLSGGLRIRAINHYDADGTHQGQRYYRYGMYEEGTGLLMHRPVRETQNGRFHYSATSYEQKVAYLQGSMIPPFPCETAECLAVLATETKTTYRPASALSYNYSDGAPIYYQKVTEYRQDQEQTGRTVHEYFPPDHFYDPLDVPMYASARIPETNIPYIRTGGLMGLQKSVTAYRGRGQGVPGYERVSKTEYEYQRYLRPEQIRVVYSFTRVLYVIAEGYYTGTMENIYSAWFDPSPNYVYGQYGIASARVLAQQGNRDGVRGSGQPADGQPVQLCQLALSAAHEHQHHGQQGPDNPEDNQICLSFYWHTGVCRHGRGQQD
ncbi:hypothetical protein FAZ15_05655 [Sphingobacterium olei]|uniref:RHS repeat-associated core domain-containing protein n=1 Tax=Sphingobacterium olei TaxID=2571155 RepID=A0A4U0P3T0_9SPHI|nr:hypothetical protein [Sphingobacterium olei]TJZ61997.1 hypothetical protein FAZ15_05655 [Sphingobacterium olei]